MGFNFLVVKGNANTKPNRQNKEKKLLSLIRLTPKGYPRKLSNKNENFSP